MSDELTVEQKIIRDFKRKGKVVWHTYDKTSELDEMDLDYKILAAIHSLKQANKACRQIALYDKYKSLEKEWRDQKNEKMNVFMEIFCQIEGNLKDQHGIELPDDVTSMKKLRKELK